MYKWIVTINERVCGIDETVVSVELERWVNHNTAATATTILQFIIAISIVISIFIFITITIVIVIIDTINTIIDIITIDIVPALHNTALPIELTTIAAIQVIRLFQTVLHVVYTLNAIYIYILYCHHLPLLLSSSHLLLSSHPHHILFRHSYILFRHHHHRIVFVLNLLQYLPTLY